MKHQEKAQSVSIFTGQNGAPRHVAVVPLSADIDVAAIIRALNESVDVSAEISPDSATRVRVDRFRQTLQYIPAKYDLMNALDVCRMADFVILALSAQVEVEEQGELLLRSIEGQGISNVIAMVQVSPGISYMAMFAFLQLTLICIGFGPDQPGQEAPAGGSFSQVFCEPLFPVRRKGPLGGLSPGVFQRHPFPLHSYTQGYPLA